MPRSSVVPLHHHPTVHRWLAAIAITAALNVAEPASAAALRLGPLTFSEVSGDFVITGGRFDGSAFTLEQAVYGPNINLFTAIDGFRTACPYRGGCYFTFQSVLTNLTGTPWILFDHELQEIYGIPSPEADGLSFAQAIPEVRPFTSTNFGGVDEVTDVRDYVNYSGGVVAPGATVLFRYVIADTTPLDRFYLLQRPNFQVGGVGFVNPTPPPPVVVEPPPVVVEPPPVVVEPPPVASEPPPSEPPVTEPPVTEPEIVDPPSEPPPTSSPGNSAAVPEPSTILGLLTFGAIAGVAKRKVHR